MRSEKCAECFWYETSADGSAAACFSPKWNPREHFDMAKHCSFAPIDNEEVCVLTADKRVMYGTHGNLGTCTRTSAFERAGYDIGYED